MPLRLTIQHCHNYAASHGGVCLETVYINQTTKMGWRCAEGHEWRSAFHMRHYNQWCPKCAGVAKPTIEECKELAISRGGLCLSTEYINKKTKMRWQCSEGHIWDASYDNIKNGGRWCPRCAGNIRLTIDDCHAIATERRGKCHSKKYDNNCTKLHWECEFGHHWKSIFSSVKAGHWCPVCYGNARHTIEDCRKTAIERNGKCISNTYDGVMKPMEWECEFMHRWLACYNNIRNGKQWCPTCSKRKSEKVAFKLIQDITCLVFKHVRPSWLLYENGKNLELDGYCEAEAMAFEYHGKQHYEYCKFFHQGDTKYFELQKERDLWKEKKCVEEKVDLIIIPYTYDYNNEDKMRQFIEVELAKIYTKRGKSADVDGYSTYPDKIECHQCRLTSECDVISNLGKFPYCCPNITCKYFIGNAEESGEEEYFYDVEEGIEDSVAEIKENVDEIKIEEGVEVLS